MASDPDATWELHLDDETRSALEGSPPPSELEVPGLTVLCHPQFERVGETVALLDLVSGRAVEVSRHTPFFATPGEAVRRPLADPYLSRRPIRLAPAANGGVVLDVSGSGTAVEVDGTPLDEGRVLTSADLVRGVVLLLAGRVALLLHLLLPSPPRKQPHFGLVGESSAVLAMRRRIAQVADLAVPVLLRGETGTGKELAARAIHDAGPRAEGAYLAVNMGAIPPTLAAAELFGAAKGAFSGADRKRPGYFSRADGGTLFLDEVGEMAPEVQVLLLRTLESGEIQPVGAEAPYHVDVRVIAATDSALAPEAEGGSFRLPLLHRLSGYEIRLPPLRARRDDIGRLIAHFLREELGPEEAARLLSDPGPDAHPWLPAPLVARLAVFSWPGNVRQLRNAVREMAIESREAPQARLGPQLATELAAAKKKSEEPAPPPAIPTPATSARPIYRPADQVEEIELLAALRTHSFRIKAAAAHLGISRTALYKLIDRSPRVRKPRDLEKDEIAACLARCDGDLERVATTLEVSRKGLRRRMTELGMD